MLLVLPPLIFIARLCLYEEVLPLQKDAFVARGWKYKQHLLCNFQRNNFSDKLQDFVVRIAPQCYLVA